MYTHARNASRPRKFHQTVCCVTNETEKKCSKFLCFVLFRFVSLFEFSASFLFALSTFFHKNINYHIDSVNSTHLDLL